MGYEKVQLPLHAGHSAWQTIQTQSAGLAGTGHVSEASGLSAAQTCWQTSDKHSLWPVSCVPSIYRQFYLLPAFAQHCCLVVRQWLAPCTSLSTIRNLLH